MPVQTQLQRPQVMYIHKETTNQSFLDMHYYLKSVGIVNNDFFLCLLDAGLAGVDPRDPNLSAPMKGRVLLECKRNYWYFLREVARIPIQGDQVNGGIRFQLHRGNLAMNFLYMMNFNFYITLPRQTGKTTAALFRYLWCYNFGTTNSEIMFIHKDHPGSKNNLKHLKEYRDALPSYLQLSATTGADGKKLKVPNTVVMIEHPFNHNRIVTFPSARTKDAANNLGRGSTMPLQYYDEFAFMPYNKEVYMAAAPAFSKAAKNAERNHAPYGMVLTTTPGDLLTTSGEFAYMMLKTATPWSEDFYDYDYNQLKGLKEANTNNAFFYITYSYQQLGLGQDYFKEMVQTMQGSWPDIRREVLLEWAESSTDCPFTQEDLDKIKLHLKEPIRTIRFGRFHQYEFQVYEDIDLQYPPIIGVDVAGATYNDSSAITVIDSHTTRVTATLNCNYIPTDDLAEVIYELVSKYMNNAVINIERNGGFGSSVIARLVKTSVKKNLYWEEKDVAIEEAYNGVRMEKRKRRMKVYCINSTREIRRRLIEILYDRVALHKDKFVAPILHSEMSAMEVKKPSGKVEHSDKTHDDQVFSYLMALYVWYDGKNLTENWHILKNTIKTDQDEDLEELEFEAALEHREKLDQRVFDVEGINDDINKDLDWVIKANGIKTSEDVMVDQYMDRLQRRDTIFALDKHTRDQFASDTGVDPSMYNNINAATYTKLPDSLFTSQDPQEGLLLTELDADMDINSYYVDSNVRRLQKSYLKGNLASMWDDLD